MPRRDNGIFAVWAPRYARRKIPIFPLHTRGKRPPAGFTGGFRRATCELAQIAAWVDEYPDGNIGLYPGGAALLVFDVDGDEGMADAERLGVLEQPTLRVETRRGWHYYFRLAPDDYFGNVTVGAHCDIRAHAGYVICPPSIHPSGHVYRWAPSCRAPAPLPSVLREALSRAKLKEEAPGAPIPPLELPDLDTLARRVRAYIDRLPSGLAAGGGRNNSTFRLSAWLLRDMGIPPRDAWPWVLAYNATHRPGLSESELAATFLSAQKHGSRRVGAGLERDPRIAERRVRLLPQAPRTEHHVTLLEAS